MASTRRAEWKCEIVRTSSERNLEVHGRVNMCECVVVTNQRFRLIQISVVNANGFSRWNQHGPTSSLQSLQDHLGQFDAVSNCRVNFRAWLYLFPRQADSGD